MSSPFLEIIQLLAVFAKVLAVPTSSAQQSHGASTNQQPSSGKRAQNTHEGYVLPHE